mmetsp:Transcript_20425/g.28297  ORF Transcript_20425/g.28297 Transcript_20425/m.28297 type:complete len:161 (+) Transcript_20425:51-533(+)
MHSGCLAPDRTASCAMPIIELDSNYGYVLLTLGASWLLNGILIFQVSRARKLYGVYYPSLYADVSNKNAHKFNCVQRAHQNTLESLSAVQVLLVINGLFQPIATSVFGMIWVLTRVLYGFGYATKGPKGRLLGVYLSLLGVFPLIGQVFYNAVSLLGFLN